MSSLAWRPVGLWLQSICSGALLGPHVGSPHIIYQRASLGSPGVSIGAQPLVWMAKGFIINYWGNLNSLARVKISEGQRLFMQFLAITCLWGSLWAGDTPPWVPLKTPPYTPLYLQALVSETSDSGSLIAHYPLMESGTPAHPCIQLTLSQESQTNNLDWLVQEFNEFELEVIRNFAVICSCCWNCIMCCCYLSFSQYGNLHYASPLEGVQK